MYKFFQKVIQVLSVLVLIGTAIFLFWLYKIGILNNQNALSNLLQNQGVYGSLTFIGLQIIQVVIPIIPGGVTTVVGFMAFGPILGFILNYVGIVIGSIILFLLTRRYGKPFILLFVDEKSFKHYEQKLASSTYETVFALNMASPISPADILVMVTGLSRMSFKRFLYIILICKPISIVAFSYFWIYGGRFIKSFL